MEKRKGKKEKARSVHLSVQIFEFGSIKIEKGNARGRNFSRPSYDLPTYPRTWTRHWSGIKIFPTEESYDWSIQRERRVSSYEGRKLAGGLFSWFTGGLLFRQEEEKFFRCNGVHVTPVQPDPTVRRYVARTSTWTGV